MPRFCDANIKKRFLSLKQTYKIYKNSYIIRKSKNGLGCQWKVQYNSIYRALAKREREKEEKEKKKVQ